MRRSRREKGIHIWFRGDRLRSSAGAGMMKSIADTEESITVRMPRGAGLALERAAIGAHSRPAQLARRMLLDGLRASGFDLASGDDSASQQLDF